MNNTSASKLATFALAVAFVALAAIVVHSALDEPVPEKQETAFERVMRTRTLRCAYGIRPPNLSIDPNTGKLSGISYEIMEAIGKVTNLKIDWQEEVGYGSFPAQLSGGKEDAYCLTMWASAQRASSVELTAPVLFTSLDIYVRDGDLRFDNNLAAVNDENVTIALIDGSSQKAVASATFPKARQYSLPGDSDGAQVILALATGKSDVVLSEAPIIEDYNRRNPDKKLKRVPNGVPVRIYGEAFSVAKGEIELRDFLNAAINELQGDGAIDRIINPYEEAAGAILRATKPYTGISKP